MRNFFAEHRNEKAFVLPMVAICLGVLILFVGFGVDISAWYLRASQMQRASDSAALAAAAKMPDVDSATVAAEAAASKNGFVDGQNGVRVKLTPILPNKYSVEIHDENVQSYFAKAAIDNIQLTRKATGEFLNSVPLGSPYSWLGTGAEDTANPDVPKQNYLLAVNGWCTAKEDGDLFLSYWDGNKGGPGSKNTQCPAPNANPGSANKNSDYSSDGYSYIVDLPIGASPSYAQIYDAGYNYGLPNTVDASAQLANDAMPDVTTTYELYDTRYTDDITDDREPLEVLTFTSRDLTKDTNRKWWAFTTRLTNPSSTLSHKYRIKVTTLGGEQKSWGVNSFGLRATINGDTKARDSRKTGSEKSPRVYGQNAMSVFASLKPNGGGTQKVTFYLAQVDPGYAGDPMTVSLWDPGDPTGPGEKGKSISLIAPDGKKKDVHWSAVPNDKMSPYSGYEADGEVDLSAEGTPPGQPGTRYGKGIFNDRRLDMTFQIPSDYPQTVAAAKNDWWMIEYNIPASSSPADRATWSVTISGSDPVHLVRN